MLTADILVLLANYSSQPEADFYSTLQKVQHVLMGYNSAHQGKTPYESLRIELV
jgi:hypothetical protein